MKPMRSIALVLTGVLLMSCTTAEEFDEGEHPVALRAVPGTDLKEVTLTDQAVQQLGIETDTVRELPTGLSDVAGATAQKAVRYAAVVYDSNGSTWTYVVLEPHTYVRQSITVQAIENDTAILTAGPPPGTPVVVVGAPELLGAEVEISGEE